MKNEDIAANDPFIGWVSIQEINNVFMEALRELDQLTNDPHVFKHVETVKHELFRRAKHNYKEYLAFNPVKKIEVTSDSRDAYEKRLAAIRNRFV